MSSPLTNLFGVPPNNGSLMQIEEFSMTYPQQTTITGTGDIDSVISLLEKGMITNLIKGATANDIDASFSLHYKDVSNGIIVDIPGTYTNLTASSPSYQTHILINNSIIDTPNLGLISYLVDASYRTHIIDISLGTNNTFGTNTATSFLARIKDSSTNYISQEEVIKFYFIDSREVGANGLPVSNGAGDISNTDAGFKYYVGFDDHNAAKTIVRINDFAGIDLSFSNTTDNNYWMSKIVNSSLNNKIGGQPNKPIFVYEPSFNSTYPLGYEANGVMNSLPFTHKYTTSSYMNSIGVSGDIIVPTVSVFTGNNKNPSNVDMYQVSFSPNTNLIPISREQWGTWKLDQSGSAVLNVIINGTTNTGTPGDLPFFQGVAGENDLGTQMPADLSDLSFQYFFPNVGSDISFGYSIVAQANTGGGYYFNYPGSSDSDGSNNSTIYNKTDSSYIAMLDFANLANNNIYMRNNYQNAGHKLIITDGSLALYQGINASGETFSILQDISYTDANRQRIDLGGKNFNGYSTFGNEAEYLTEGLRNVSGTVVINIRTGLGRIKNALYSGSLVDPSAIILYNVFNTGSLRYNDLSSNQFAGVIDPSWRIISDIDVSFTCLLDGLRRVGVVGGPDASSQYGYFYKNTTTPNATIIHDPSSTSTLYSARNIQPAQFNGKALDYIVRGFSGDYVYIEITTTQDLLSLTNTYLYDISINPTGFDAPEFEPLQAGINEYFLPEIHAHNLYLEDFSFNNYRALFLTKTLTDLSNEGLRIENGWSIVNGITGTIDTPGPTYGDISFSYQNDPRQYVYTKFNNLNVPGTNANGLNIGRACGINITDLTNPGDETGPDLSANYEYKYTVTYKSSKDLGGTDFVEFSAVNRSDFSSNCHDFTLQPIIIQGDNSAGFISVVQLPIGEYYNVYLRTPQLVGRKDASGSYINGPNEIIDGSGNDLSGNFVTTLSFKRSCLFSLLGSIQGNMLADPSSSYTDASGNGWVDLSASSGETSSRNDKDSVSAYYPFTSQLRMSGVGTSYLDGSNGTVSMLLRLNPDYRYNNFNLVWPAYTVRLDSSGETVANITGKQFFVENDASGASSTFNPAMFPNTSSNTKFGIGAGKIGGGRDLSMSTFITLDGCHNILNFKSNAHLNISGSIEFPNQINSSLSIWWCPQDVYRTDITLSGGILGNTTSEYTKYTRSHDLSNSAAYLDNGVFLTATKNMQADNRGKFGIAGDRAKIQLVNGNQLGQTRYYDVSAEISDANGGLDISNIGFTRSYHLPWYRGYAGNPDRDQVFIIHRTPTTARVDISNGSTLFQSADNLIVAKGKLHNSLNFVRQSGDTGSADIGSIGLNLTFYESMLPPTDVSYGSVLDVSINVLGDQVLINEYYDGALQLGYYPINTTLKAVNGVLTTNFGEGNLNNTVYARKVKATTNYATDDQSFVINKSQQTVRISYSEQYLGVDPSGFTYVDVSNVFNSDISSSVQLNPNLTLKRPGASYINSSITGTNTPTTYLVIAPPYLGFRALDPDGVKKRDPSSNGVVPFDMSKPDEFDPSYNVVWYLPASTTNPSDVSDNLHWNPFSNTKIIETANNYPTDLLTNLNNMTFTTRTTGKSLTSYLPPTDSSYNLEVQGNYLYITEVVNGVVVQQTDRFDNVQNSGFMYKGYVSDLSNTNFNSTADATNTTTPTYNSIYIDSSNQIYNLDFRQNLKNLDTPTGGLTHVLLQFTNAFIRNEYDFSMNPNIRVAANLYGVSPLDLSGSYYFQPYKYENSDYNINYHQAVTNGAHIKTVQFIATELSKLKPIKLPDVSFGDTPYNFKTQQMKLTSQDVSNAGPWQLVTSFNPSGYTVPLNFEIVALSNPGLTQMNRLVDVDLSSATVRCQYITLPDILNIQSGEGASVLLSLIHI